MRCSALHQRQGLLQVQPGRVKRYAVPPGGDARHREGEAMVAAQFHLLAQQQASKSPPHVAKTEQSKVIMRHRGYPVQIYRFLDGRPGIGALVLRRAGELRLRQQMLGAPLERGDLHRAEQLAQCPSQRRQGRGAGWP